MYEQLEFPFVRWKAGYSMPWIGWIGELFILELTGILEKCNSLLFLQLPWQFSFITEPSLWACLLPMDTFRSKRNVYIIQVNRRRWEFVSFGHSPNLQIKLSSVLHCANSELYNTLSMLHSLHLNTAGSQSERALHKFYFMFTIVWLQEYSGSCTFEHWKKMLEMRLLTFILNLPHSIITPDTTRYSIIHLIEHF